MVGYIEQSIVFMSNMMALAAKGLHIHQCCALAAPSCDPLKALLFKSFGESIMQTFCLLQLPASVLPISYNSA